MTAMPDSARSRSRLVSLRPRRSPSPSAGTGLRDLLGGLVATAAILGAVPAGVAPASASAATAAARAELPPPRERLATELVRMSRLYAENAGDTIAGLTAALALAREAAMQVPDDANAWRVVRDTAVLLEAPRLRAEALANLGRIDVRDETVQLDRLRLAVDDRTNTVEERRRAAARLLAAADEGALGGPVASRLALDLADLERRAGDDERAAAALARAVGLDPGHAAAAAEAAGVVLGRVDDPEAIAEMLVAATVADPTTSDAASALAELAAGIGATRTQLAALQVLVAQERAGGMLESADLATDLALAHWSAGRLESARRTLEEHLEARDTIARVIESQQAAAETLEGRLDDREAADRWIPTPLFATVRLAAYASGEAGLSLDAGLVEDVRLAFRTGREESEAFLDDLRFQLDDAVAAEQLTPEAADVEYARRRNAVDAALVEQAEFEAYVAGVLLDDASLARDALDRLEDRLEAGNGTAPDADAPVAHVVRMAEAFARGDETAVASAIDAAAAALRARAESGDPAVEPFAFAVAEARRRQGRPEDAIPLYDRVAETRRGRLIGLLATERLKGRSVAPPAPDPSADVIDRLAGDILGDVRGWLTEPSRAVHVQATFRDGTIGPYEPLLLDIVVTNRTDVPLAIGPEGPIRSLALVEVESNATGRGLRIESPPVVVDLGTRLTLPPRGRLERTVDLRRRPVLGELLHRAATVGALVRARVALNHRLASGSGPGGMIAVPQPLGSADRTSPVRIDGPGLTLDPAMLAQMTEATQRPREPGSIRDIALLAALLGRDIDLAGSDEIVRAAINDARNRTATVFAALDAVDQAWLLLVTPIEATRRLRWADSAVRSDDRLVQMAWLAAQATTADDPVIARTIDGDDLALARVAAARRAAILARSATP